MNKIAIFKKSTDLDNIYDDIYDKLLSQNKYMKFNPIMKKIATVFIENGYENTETCANLGGILIKKSLKVKKPVYLVYGKKSNTYAFFLGNLSAIKALLSKEYEKISLQTNLKNEIKTISNLDAAILAYLSLVPKPIKDYSILNFLSKDVLSLGQCLLDIKGKYSKEVKKQANIYREWAIYKTASSSKRKNLNLSCIVK